MEYPWICVTLVLGLVVCSTCFTSATEVSSPHCHSPLDSPPCICEIGWYGGNCTKRCSLTCSARGCNQTTGKCGSCKAGYHSSDCTLKCPPNCNSKSAGPAKCDQDTANCTSCQPTWWGSKCTNKCDSSCENGVCDFVHGHCHRCRVGKTGENCSEECPGGCLGRLCHRGTKNCTSGCACGYFGEVCDKECGRNCKEVEYSANVTGASNKSSLCVCHQNTGQCHFCKSGYWGDMCDKTCPKQCPACSQNNGTCGSSSISSDTLTGQKGGVIAGSVTGVIILALLAVIAMYLLYSRRHRAVTGSSGHGEDRRLTPMTQENLVPGSDVNTYNEELHPGMLPV